MTLRRWRQCAPVSLAALLVAPPIVATAQAPWPKLIQGAWAPFGGSGEVKLFATLWTPTTWVRGWMRYEFLKPQEGPTGAYRSARVLSEYDCKNKRSRAVLEVRYAGSNLDRVVDMSAPVGRWEKFDPSVAEGEVAETFCKIEAEATAELAAEQRARGEPPVSLQQLATTLDRPFSHVRAGDWHALPPSETGKLFVRGAKTGVYPQVEVRWEYLEPLMLAGEAIKSSWHVVEMNCATLQHRFATTMGYRQSNLKGPGFRVARSTDWLPMSGDYQPLKMICDRELEPRGDGVLAWREAAGPNGSS